MNYISRFFFSVCSLFVSLLFFQIHSEKQECLSDKKVKDCVAIIENLDGDGEAASGEIFRLTVAGNITLKDTTSKEIGNIMKKDSAGNVRRFIHNFGQDNTFVGIRSGNFSMTDIAANNTAVGVDSLRHNVSGKRNTAIGKAAATENRGGDSNVAVGYRALRNNTVGSFNTAVGDSALVDLSSTDAASSNVAIGRNALRGLTEGSDNLAVGGLAGFFTNETKYTGSRNVFAGYQAGASENPGSDNIYIGYQVGSMTSGGINNVYIGNLGTQESHTLRIGTPFNAQSGDGQNRCYIAGIYRIPTGRFDAIPVVIDSNGQLGTTSSSRQFKDNISQIHDESEALYNLSPVTFVYKDDASATKRYGLIAEQVQECFSDLVVKDNDGVVYTVRYEFLPVLLLNEIKKHHNAIQQQNNDISRHKQDIQKQECDMKNQEYIVQQQREAIENILCVVNALQKKVHHYMVNNN